MPLQIPLPPIPRPELSDNWQAWAEKIILYFEDIALALITPEENLAAENGFRVEILAINDTSPQTLTHNLGAFPVVQVVDNRGVIIEVDVTHDSANAITIAGWAGEQSLAVIMVSGRFRDETSLVAVATPQTITHSLGERPICQTLDASDVQVEVDQQHTGINALDLSGWGGTPNFRVLCVSGVARVDRVLSTVASPQIIEHNLGAIPIVQVHDSSGNLIVVDVQHGTRNRLALSGWSGSITMRVVCIIY